MRKAKSAKELLKNIHLVRREPVMWDSDLAALYGVTTAELMRRITACMELPEELMFQVREDDVPNSRVPEKSLSFVFSSGGVSMLCAVFREDEFVELNIELARAFVKYRELLGVWDEKQLRNKSAISSFP